MLFIMEYLQYSKEDQTLEAHHTSGYIFIYLDDKPVEKVTFSQKLRIKFVFLRSPLHENKVEETCVNSTNEPSSLLNIGSPNCDWNDLKADDSNESYDLPKENEILLSEHLRAEVYSDSNWDHNYSSLIKEAVDTLKLDQDDSTKELVSSSDTTVGETDFLAGLHCKLCQKWFPCFRKNKEHTRDPAYQTYCIQCGKIFPSKGDLFRHQFAAYDLSFLQSQFPEFTINTRAQKLGDKEKIICPICSVATTYKQFKYRHLYSHFDELSYKCCLCGYAMKNASQLATHFRNHLARLPATIQTTEVAEQPKNAGKVCTSGNKKLASNIQDNTSTKTLKNIETKKNKEPISSNNQEQVSSVGLNEQNFRTEAGSQLSANKVRDMADTNQGGAKSYPCPYCKKSFPSRALLHSHKETPSLNLKCQSCNAVLPSQAWMIIHEFEAHKKHTLKEKEAVTFQEMKQKGSSSDKLHSNVRRPKCRQFVSCPVCSVLVTRLVLHEHIMRTHTLEKPYRCCICGFPCHGSDQYRDHCDRHIGKSKKGFFRCYSCPEIFTSRSDFCKHTMVHKTVCHFCNVDFKLTSVLDAHYNAAHLDQLLKCKQCSKRLPTERKLILHEKHHRFHISRPCPTCGAMVISLVKHMERYHTEPASEFLCSLCPKKFKRQTNLKNHLQWHAAVNKEEQLACPRCPKTFSSAYSLRGHLRVHLRNKQHRCPTCQRQFREKYQLKTHMRVHSVHKLFRCEICSEGFNFKVSLINHQKYKH